MTCELNHIYNASFIMGSPSEVVTKLGSARDLYNKNRVTYCIINAGTNMGRGMQNRFLLVINIISIIGN